MNRTFTSMQKKAAAVGLLALLAGGVYGLAVAPLWERYQSTEAHIAALEKRLGAYRTAAAQGPELERRLAQTAGEMERSAYYFRSDKAALAAAELQELVRNKLAAAKGQLVSSQFSESRREEGLEAVSIQVRMRGDIRSLHKVLHLLETGRPLVFVDELAVVATPAHRARRTAGAAAVPDLDVRFRATGYLRAEPPGDPA